MIGIVPDGAAAIRFGSTTVPVHDNAFAADLPPGQAPSRTRLGADGKPY